MDLEKLLAALRLIFFFGPRLWPEILQLLSTNSPWRDYVRVSGDPTFALATMPFSITQLAFFIAFVTLLNLDLSSYFFREIRERLEAIFGVTVVIRDYVFLDVLPLLRQNIWPAVQKIGNLLDGLEERIINKITEWGNTLADSFEVLLAEFTSFRTELGEIDVRIRATINAEARGVIREVTNNVRSFFNTFSSELASVYRRLLELFQNLDLYLREQFTIIFDQFATLQGGLTALRDDVQDVFLFLSETLAQWRQQAYNDLLQFYEREKAFWDSFIAGALTNLQESLVTTLQPLLDQIRDEVHDILLWTEVFDAYVDRKKEAIIISVRENLLRWYEQEKERLRALFIGWKDEIINAINAIPSGITEDFRRILEDINSKLETMRTDLDTLSAVWRLPLGSGTLLLERVAAALITATAELAGLQLEVTALITGIAGIGGEIGALAFRISSLSSKINDLPTEIEKKLKSALQEFTREVAIEVSNRIVGESYYKWNSTSSFYPTLITIFKEKDQNGTSRKSQVKVRLPVLASELTPEDVTDLKAQVQMHTDLEYSHGSVRGNYVSKDKRFKTTVFCETRQQVVSVLSTLCEIVKEPFAPENLSFTEGRKRDPITRREAPLGGVDAYVQDYNEVFPLKLYRVVLLVNGLEKPIVLFEP